MMRRVFDEQLDKLNIDLTKMGHLVEVSIENMIDAFKHHDKALAKEIIENDRLINDMERSIESRAFSLILRQQPIASDLRNVTSALKIVTDLERIGDQAADIEKLFIILKGNMLIVQSNIFQLWLRRQRLWFMKRLMLLLKRI